MSPTRRRSGEGPSHQQGDGRGEGTGGVYGRFPADDGDGTFIINGAERVIVSQLVRSPSVYYSMKIDKNGKPMYTATVIPNRGAWLEFETDTKDVLYVRIDRTRKIPVTVLLRALGFSSDADILNLLGEDEFVRNTLDKDNTGSTEKALIEIYERLRPGEPPTAENARSLLYSRFFDPKRYDLAHVGRYKINKKLHIKNRLLNQRLAEPIVDAETGEIIAEAGQMIDRRTSTNCFPIWKGKGLRNQGYPARRCGGRHLPSAVDQDFLSEQEASHQCDLQRPGGSVGQAHHPADIVATVNYFINLLHGVGSTTSTTSATAVSVPSETAANQFRIGLSGWSGGRERMSIQDANAITPQALINIRPVIASIKEFFGSSQLSQFMDQTNPLAELTHKRRLSAWGRGTDPGAGGFEVRDVHHSHYGRMCPIETPEGPTSG